MAVGRLSDGLEQINPGTLGIRGRVQENSCRAVWTPEAWVLLPDDGS